MDVTLPSGLQTLSFGYGSEFDQSLEQMTLPSDLQTLMCGSGLDQSLEKATLPSGFGTHLRGEDFGNVSWTSACRTSSARIVARTCQVTVEIDCLFEGIDYSCSLP